MNLSEDLGKATHLTCATSPIAAIVFSERNQPSQAILQFHVERMLHERTPIARFESWHNERKSRRSSFCVFEGDMTANELWGFPNGGFANGRGGGGNLNHWGHERPGCNNSLCFFVRELLVESDINSEICCNQCVHDPND